MSSYCQWLLFIVLLTVQTNGQGWKNQLYSNVTNVDIVSATWSSPTTSVVVGYSGLSGLMMRTTNAGSTWSTVYSGATAMMDIAATFSPDLAAATPCFVAVGYSYVGSNFAGIIYVSMDNGRTFTIANSIGNTKLQGVTIGKNGNAYAVGISTLNPALGKVYLSSRSLSPSYASWTDVSPPSKRVQLMAVSTSDGVHVVAVGYGGAVFYSRNNGTTWNTGSSSVSVVLQCVAAGNASVAMAAGDSTTLLRTLNGGANWTLLASATATSAFSSDIQAMLPAVGSFRFHAISMVGPSIAYAALSSTSGSSGLIIRTIDGGRSWQLQYTAPTSTQSIYTIAMMNSFVGVAGFSKPASGVQLAIKSMGKRQSKGTLTEVVHHSRRLSTYLPLFGNGLYPQLLLLQR